MVVEARLTEDERRAILEVVSRLTSGREAVAVCAYGSKVAGYSRPDSDYDVIVVLKDYHERIKYRYVGNHISVSALLVDKDHFIGDAEHAQLGEFVIGRLLNIYEPLVGQDFLRSMEVKFKKRVVLEALHEIASSQGAFVIEIIVPIKYFLYDKLKKRSTIYPPALYSYAKTYSGVNAEGNLKASISGFEEALKELEEAGLLVRGLDTVKLVKAGYAGQLARLSSMLAHTARGITQYAIHGYAGRVELDVVGKELLSKLKRSREVGSVPEEILHPKSLWSIEEGLLIAEGDDWLQLTSERMGLKEYVKVSEEQLGELYNVSKVYVLEGGGRQIKLVVKKFRDIKSVKWALLNVWARRMKRFSMTPLPRLHREYSAIRSLRRLGLNTPEVVSVVLSDRILITRFVEGVNLGMLVEDFLEGRADDLRGIKMYGQAVGLVHAAGYTLGDTKPSNAIYSDGDIWLTDLEQTGSGGDAAWDIAEFIYYSSKLTFNVEGAKAIAEAFLRGYVKHGDREPVKRALNTQYLATFGPFMAPHISKAVRKIMETYGEGG